MQISNRGKMQQMWEESGGEGISKQLLDYAKYGDSLGMEDKLNFRLNSALQSQRQQQQEGQLSYQSTRLSQYIQLQLSQLQNTLHYIQKKHSLNQIKQSISRSYNIFCETEPIFKQLKANSLYAQVKKLVNCYSIIYVVLMDKIQTGSKEGGINQDGEMKASRVDGESSSSDMRKEIDINVKTKTTIKAPNEHIPLTKQQSKAAKLSKPKQLGGVHLYNQQYNRHIQSDEDRLKRKPKQQLQKKPPLQSNMKSQKQKLKQEILKQLNSNYIDGTLQGPDELQLFFNFNSNGSNKFGSQPQLITFQDQLQQIAAFFKESQDQAMQFLNKSRDQYQTLNFNSGFKQTLTIVKQQKDEQMNRFIFKFRNMFERLKQKAIQKEKEINFQIIELKKIQEKIAKPFKIDMQTQTIISYQEEIFKIKRQIEELTRNYTALQQLHKIENQKEEREITLLEHKLALADREQSLIKKEIEEKNHFINFLNQKINQNTDTRVLKKFSTLYKNSIAKNGNRLKMQLEQMEKERLYRSNHSNGGKAVSEGRNIANNFNENKNYMDSNENNSLGNEDKSTNQQSVAQSAHNRQSIQQQQHQRVNKKSYTSPIQDFQKPNKKKRKPGISLFATPDKRLSTAVIDQKTSLNFINEIVQQVLQQNMAKENTSKSLSEDSSTNGYRWLSNANNWVSGKSSEQSSRREFSKTQQEGQLSQNMDDPKENNLNNASILKQSKQSKQRKVKKKTSIIKSNTSNNNIKGVSSPPSTNNNNIKGNSSSPSAINNKQKLKKTSSGMLQQKKSYFGANSSSKLKANRRSMKGSKQNSGKQSQLERNRISIVKEEEEDIRNSETNNNSNQKQSQDNTHVTEQQQLLMELNSLPNTMPVDNQQQQQDNQSEQQQLKQQQLSQMLQEEYLKQITTKHQQSADKLTPIEQKTLRKTTGSNLTNDTRSAVQNSLATMHNYKNNNSKGIESVHNSNSTIRTGSSQHQLQRSTNYPNNQLSTIQHYNNNSINNENKGQQEQLMLMPIHGSIEQSIQLIEKLNQLSHMAGINNHQKEQLLNTYINSLYKANKSKKSRLMSNMVQLSIQIDKPPQEVSQSKKQISQNNTSFQNKFIKKQSYSHISQTQNNNYKLQNQSIHRLNALSNTLINNLYRNNNKTTQDQHHLQTQSPGHDSDDGEMLMMRKYDQHQYRLNSTPSDKKTHRKTIQPKTYFNHTQYEKTYGVNAFSKNNLSSTLIHQYDQDKLQDYLEKNAIKTAAISKSLQEFKTKIHKIHQAKCGENCKHLQRYIQNFHKYKTNQRETLKIHVEDVNHTLTDEGSTTKINKQSPLSFPSINQLNNTAFSSKGFINGRKSSAKLLPKK